MDNTELLTKVYGLLEERKKCRAAGYSLSAVRASGYSLSAALAAGYSLSDALAAGYSLSAVRAAGYSLSDDELETLPTWLLESIKVSIQA